MKLSCTTQIGVLLTVLTVYPTVLLADPYFTHLSVADGLSHGDVRAIVQDRQGFMWFGTWLGGLNRYDGYTFKVYQHDAQNDRSLGCDSIWALYVDRAGVLWVGTVEGVDQYDRDTDSFVHYRHRADDPASRPRFQARNFIEDKSGTLWVLGPGGLSRFDRTSGKFFTFKINPGDPTGLVDTDIGSFCLDTSTGFLWLGTSHEGVIVLDPATGRITRYKNNPNDPASLSGNYTQHIFQDREGNLWISTLRGLNRFDRKTHTFIRYLHDPGNPASLSDDYVTRMCEDQAGHLWVVNNSGLNLMDRARGTFTRYLNDPNDASSLSGNVINSDALYVDSAGALWIGMRSSGVGRLASGPDRFTTYRHNSQDATGPGNNVITGLASGSNGELWIGSEAGLDRFDGKTFTHTLVNPNDASGLNPGPQRVVAIDSHGAIWTATYGGGLDRLEGQRVTHFRHDRMNSDSPAGDNIVSLVHDTVGGMWIGVHGKALDYFDGKHFTHFTPDATNPAGLPTSWVTPSLLDGRGMLWVATADMGLVRLDPNTRKFTTYLLDPNQPGNQAANWTEDVYSDGTNLWIASPTGLFRFDPETGKFTRHYTKQDGLPNNTVVGVLGDAQGNLWVSTANGLSKFDPKTETFRNYDVSDGLQGNGFSEHCHAKFPDGRMFFGGPNGLSAFYPDKLADNPIPPPVVLTEFDLFNKSVNVVGKDSPLQKAINAASTLTLSYQQSVFSFQFAALDYTAPQKNRYAYKLEPFDLVWQYTDAKRRFATYTHLNPGNYTFRVKASNNDGVWNEQGVALHLTILPPWWKTNWFRAVCVAVLLALIWLAHRIRVRELEEREKKFREAVESLPALAFIAASEKDRTFVNRGWVEYTGLSPEQALGSGWQVAVHPDDLKSVLEKWRTAATTGEPLDYEVRLRHGGNGEYRWFHARVRPLRDKHGLIAKWCGVATDVEDRKRAEEALRHLNRELRALSNCNQTLLRAADEQNLLEKICRIVCEEAGYRLAWVGYAEHDEAKSVQPVAWTGAEEGYLATVGITWADTERGRGPTGMAIRTGKCCCIQDFATDPRVAPWREGALQRGFRSSIALPLKDEHANAFGSLTIHAAQPDAFTPEEIRLLEELAGDLAFGIVTLRSRAARKQAEQDVALLSFAVDKVREAAFLIDECGRLRYVNEESCRLLGYSRAELVNLGIPDIDPEFPAERWSDHWRSLKAQRSLSFESRHRTRDGRVFPVEISANYFEYGNRAYNLAIVRDITERKRAEEELRRSEAYLAEAQRLTRIGTSAHGMNRQTLYWSAEMNRLYNFDPRQGMPTREQIWQRIHPEDLPNFRRMIERTYAKKVDGEFEFRIVLPDGTVKHVHVLVHPVFGSSGEMLELVGTNIDVTEQKRSEEARRRSEAYLAEAQKLSHTGSWAWQLANKRVTHWSEECFRIFGFDPGRGLPSWEEWDRRVHPEDREKRLRRIEEAVAQQAEYELDYRIVLPDGTLKYIHTVAHPVFDAIGNVLEYFGTAIDVTEQTLAEQSLRRSEAYLAEAQALTHTGSWALDLASGKYDYVSEECFRIFGFNLHEGLPTGEGILRQIYPEDRDRWKENFEKSLRERVGTSDEYRIVLPDGTMKYIHTTRHPVLNSAGDVAKLVGTSMDITERKRTEEMLRAQAALLDLTHDTVLVMDLQGVIRYWNCGAEERYGWAVDQALGKVAHNLLQTVFPAPFEQIKAEVMRTGRWEGEILHTRKDGTHVRVASRWALQRDEQGEPVAILETNNDITERKRAEEALRLSNAYNRSLIEASLDPLVTIGPDGKITDVNTATEAATARSRGELIGTDFCDYFTEPAQARAGYKQVFREGTVRDYPLELRHRNGRPMSVLYNASVYRDESGKVIGVFAAARDISERKRAEGALREAQTELARVARVTTMGALTASIAHEVNQPLAGVVTSANAGLNWLAANPPNLSKAREALERVRRDGTRAGEVLARIRGLLKRTAPARTSVNVNQIVNDMMALAAGELRGHNVETVLVLNPSLPAVLGDTVQLQQVMLNLITNAIEAMADVEEGQRTLRIQSTQGELEGKPAVVVAVGDTGLGLGSVDIPRLFEAFHTTKPQGMGMGLWISRSIVEEHGGRLTAQPNAGRGATFVLTIPAEHGVAE